MKKIIALLLAMILAASLFSVSAFADVYDGAFEQLMNDFNKQYPTDKFADATNDTIMNTVVGYICELYRRGAITREQAKASTVALLTGDTNIYDDNPSAKDSSQTEYDFGQGTFIAGTDFKAGTYDVECGETNGDNYGGSMSAMGDAYAAMGLDEYADMFNSYSGLFDDLASITVTTYTANGSYDNIYSIKSGNSARIIFTDGMKIEISGGNVHMKFVR